ncbi:MAG TPA: hypothetical protein VL461_08845 [Dictyobacter sp.]|jgi:hypothetical protein|nr:hypothetical protein [Dictyobacter sp.]
MPSDVEKDGCLGKRIIEPRSLRLLISATNYAGPKSDDSGWLDGAKLIESVFDKLLNAFRLARERPHALTGFQARLTAKISLHNFYLWLNEHLQRPPLAIADLVDW